MLMTNVSKGLQFTVHSDQEDFKGKDIFRGYLSWGDKWKIFSCPDDNDFPPRSSVLKTSLPSCLDDIVWNCQTLYIRGDLHVSECGNVTKKKCHRHGGSWSRPRFPQQSRLVSTESKSTKPWRVLRLHSMCKTVPFQTSCSTSQSAMFKMDSWGIWTFRIHFLLMTTIGV